MALSPLYCAFGGILARLSLAYSHYYSSQEGLAREDIMFQWYCFITLLFWTGIANRYFLGKVPQKKACQYIISFNHAIVTFVQFSTNALTMIDILGESVKVNIFCLL